MVDKTGIIYMATNKINKLSYIGQTIKLLDHRMIGHKHRSIVAKENNRFHNAIRKYGWDNFEWKILYKNIALHMLNIAEMCAIYIYDTYNNGYNSTLGGEESPMRNPEIAKKVSISKTGKNRKYGKLNPFYGKSHSPETIAKIKKYNCMYIWKITKPDGSTEIITNLKEYCDNHNLINAHMYAVANGKRKSHRRYKCEKIGRIND